MASQFEQLHFLLIPLFSQSHIIPLTDFAKLLARQGPIVSIITTPLNAKRYKKSLSDYALRANLKIQLLPIPFPGQECGLPEGCENMDSLPSPGLARPFFDACTLLQEPIQNVAQKLEPKPSCIISSGAFTWTQNLAQNLGIPRYIFHTGSCFTLSCFDMLSKSKVHESVASDLDTFYLPDMPHKIECTRSQLPDFMTKNSLELKAIVDHMKEVDSLARGTLVNSFEELEPWYVAQHKKANKNFWCIGPVALANEEMEDKFRRGNETSIDKQKFCLKWLDSKEPGSVIYACFGSMCHLSCMQLAEIGLGLESSGRPFIWIIRESDYSPDVDRWLKDNKFEERVKGLVIRGWAPQVLILSHPSVGGFLTHCGWNSIMEGICSGVPMITWPMFSEQFFNEMVVVNISSSGVKIGVSTAMKFAEELNELVKREKIKAAIDQLMDDGEEGQEMRKRARKLGEMATKSIEDGGSSHMNITLLIRDVMQQND
ncbi:hypothetical protein ACH5RR_022741 [Cinchona calisaya]|uniref:Glycosyltransferase n=1 Tax=Cinchona calisaya TaxID=153742 RepID=A0ABD2Z9R8_9GENT